MPTPPYNGTGQPAADNGGSWLGRLGSFFGASTPTYAGTGQPVNATGGMLGNATPIYAMAPAVVQPTSKPGASQSSTSQQMPVTASRSDCGCVESEFDDDESEQALMTCPIDPAALASGHIAIVIPRLSATDEQ
jgi:hypothetical protein